MFNKILVPIDGTAACETSLAYVKDIAKKYNSEIVLFNAQEIAPTIAWVNDPIAYSQTQIDPDKMAKDILAQALSCFDSDVYNISAHHAIGDAAHAILDVCEELECDAIIMSTHGNKAIKRFLLGSVTDKVVHHAKVTVVIVR